MDSFALIGHGEGVTVLVIGMLVALLLALGVLALVAGPRVRAGERILTVDGERSVRATARRTRAVAARVRRAARAGDETGRGAADPAWRPPPGTAPAGPGSATSGPAPRVELPADDVPPTDDVARLAWAGGTDATPSSRGAGGTVTLRPAVRAAPAVPAEVGAGAAGAAERVVDLRGNPAAAAPAVVPTPPEDSVGAAARRGLDLEWGEPLPGPRHAR